MLTASFSREEIGRLGEALYERKIRSVVDKLENIGKMVIIDIETEEFEIDGLDNDAARNLQARHPNAMLYGKRIGYDAAVALGGVLERTS